MRNIVAHIYSSNWETYKEFYQEAIVLAYAKDGITINRQDITHRLIVLPGRTIQSQRSPGSLHSRTISVYENNHIKYIIGVSNTGYDEDKRLEVLNAGGKYSYGNDNWHSNTYLCQGINKIFALYYNTKRQYPNVKLYFYLLDTKGTKKKSYVSNWSNILTYRELATIGFEILNIDEIDFSDWKQVGFIYTNKCNIGYLSFNKFLNDMAYISHKSHSNSPAYIKCIENYDIANETNSEEEYTTVNQITKYIYTFKVLGAQAYDCFLAMWALITLANREHKQLEFLFAKEKFNFRLGQKNEKLTNDFPTPITTLFSLIGIDVHYETTEEVLQQLDRERSQYETAKKNHILRNQELFRNNIRAKGIQTKCYLCGCEIESILQAAHLWGVAQIKAAHIKTINSALREPAMSGLIDANSEHAGEEFYKRYVLANSGDNGVWLCNNHHGLFDSHYFCFDSESGKVIIDTEKDPIAVGFIRDLTPDMQLTSDVLTARTKSFIRYSHVHA